MIASSLCLAATADTLVGKVVGITDGDTLTVRTTEETKQVRLSGIDAPEKRQDFGNAAKKALSDCAFDRPVQVETKKLDRYGRAVGKVTVEGVDCGLRQIKLGLAWHYKAYAREQNSVDRDLYARAEDAARRTRAGLWQASNPTPPWEFRRQSH